MPPLAIKAENLSKKYKVPALRDRNDTRRDHVREGIKSLINRYGRQSWVSSYKHNFWALRDVSFEIQEGEIVGIIGRNGAGKSTLLKILSRVTKPSQGRATMRGRIGSLLEVGTGFHPELTGRENVFLNGAILGMKKAEIVRKFDEIVAFAEVEKFIDTPVKRYSSGMFVRLAFAVAAHLDPDILLLDEVLSVGDLPFQAKCAHQTKKLQQANATVILVSHNMLSIKSMCKRVFYLSEGKIRFDGLPEDGIALYERANRLSTTDWGHSELTNNGIQQSLTITEIDLLDERGISCRVFDYGEKMRIHVGFEAPNEIKAPNFTVSVFRSSDNVACCNFNAAMDGFIVSSVFGRGAVELMTPPLKLVAGRYVTNVIVRNEKSAQLYTAQIGESFHVRHHVLNGHYGVFHEAAVWSWGKHGTGEATTGDQKELDRHA
jgi:lipopolysaccharide transport system ATP-binding protein